jgi:hypothetical protein
MSVHPLRNPPTRVFYPLRHGVLVTDQRLQASGHSYPIRELTEVTRSIGSMQVGRRLLLRMVAVEAPIVVAIIVAVPTWVALAAAIGYLLFAIVLMWFGGWRWPTPLELWATYRGVPTLLFLSTNHTEFNQVSRALLRAMELSVSRSIR